MAYIEAHQGDAEPDGCVFCVVLERVIPTGAGPAPGRSDVVPSRSIPYNPGHLLVLPNRHTGDLEDVTADERRRCTRCCSDRACVRDEPSPRRTGSTSA